MKDLFSNIKIQVNEKVFVKDPETSELGKKIIEQSVYLIYEIGFESFTFKKLGERIGSNESSIYRYFENKHKLLIYLSLWYWSWIEYKMVFATSNISEPWDKLEKAIRVVTETPHQEEVTKSHINKYILNKIIISEYTKITHTKEVEYENKEGYFLVFKSIIYRIIDIVKDINPNYPFTKSLVSSMVEGALHQHFFSQHLKTITDCNETLTPSDFYIHLFKTILKQ